MTNERKADLVDILILALVLAALVWAAGCDVPPEWHYPDADAAPADAAPADASIDAAPADASIDAAPADASIDAGPTCGGVDGTTPGACAHGEACVYFVDREEWGCAACGDPGEPCCAGVCNEGAGCSGICVSL